nr:ribonuclease H-like domain-containing protein [Pseudomarimonas arenosa]
MRHPLAEIPTELRFQHREQAIDPRHLLAIDTETTGLAGGTGTRAFLVGIAFIEQNELCLRQWLLSGLSGEVAMLQAFGQYLCAQHHLLSYNGKSYDLPLLRTRFCLHRLPDPSRELPHTDLLHLVRRRYRGLWADCRLQTVERQLLSIVRNDDLPGSEAPAAFRRWLQRADATQLNRVVEHNAQDLVSLMRLALRLGDIDPDQYRLHAPRSAESPVMG